MANFTLIDNRVVRRYFEIYKILRDGSLSGDYYYSRKKSGKQFCMSELICFREITTKKWFELKHKNYGQHLQYKEKK